MKKQPIISIEDIVALIPDNIYWLDKEGFYLGCNDAQAKTLGLKDRHEIVGKKNSDFPFLYNHPELLNKMDENNRDVVDSDQPKIFEEQTYDAQANLSTYLSHKTPLKDSNNETIGLLGISYKIDEIKIKENQLLVDKENAELTLKSIIAHLPGHVYWKDKEGHYLGCNDRQAHNVGYTTGEDLVGKTDFELAWHDKAEKIRENDLVVMNSGELITTEESGKLADGSTITAVSQKLPLRNKEGSVIGILGISLDITELKRAQENEKLALQKAAVEEATKRALLIFSGMSTHDLRTPLSSISLRAALLKKYVPALLDAYTLATEADLDIPHIQPKVLKDLPQAPEDILQGVREANEYIDASLKSLKGASSGDELMNKNELVECDVGRLLRRIVDNYPYKEGQEALLHYDAECDFHFKGNVIFFNRLIENLIKNAFEQIQAKGRGEIFIRCEQHNELNLIKIKDTAGGVTQSVIDQLFNGIQSTKSGGTGIGLSSAKQIMQGMDGDINAYLVEGDCIEFGLSFPANN